MFMFVHLERAFRTHVPPDAPRLWRARLIRSLYETPCALCRVPGEGAICPECDRRLWRATRHPLGGEEGPLEGATGWSMGVYRGVLRRAIRALKFEGALEVGHVLGERLAEHVHSLPMPAGTVVAPIPLHRSRRRERGHDQVAPLAWHLARRLRAPYAPMLLERERAAPPSHGLDRESRKRLAAGAFRLRPGASVPKGVILVDDVWTTGATARSALQTLKTAGVDWLGFVALARTQPGHLQ